MLILLIWNRLFVLFPTATASKMKIKFDDNLILESQNGIPYAIPQRLSTKKQVYTQAILQKIPHDTEGKVDICLKIGRYKISGGVETNNPKSELTLTFEEFKNLVAYIEKFYKPLELEVEKFIPVDSNDSKQLLVKFKSIVNSDEEIATQLLESGLLSDNIYIAIDSIKKKQALDEFEEAINRNYAESFWQDWFERNKWILGSEYLAILDERKIDTSNIADYLTKAFDGFLDVVEIKKPNGLRFWMESKDHDNYVPSADLIKAITQCQNYLYEVERESNSAKFLERTNGTKIIKPRCLLVYGRSNNWNEAQQRAFRILNSSFNQISIMTYDHLLARAKNVLGIDASDDDLDDENLLF